MVHFKEKARYDYDDLLEIIRVLRSPEGCPWDQVQTHQSIRRGLLEEAYEAAEGIDRDDADLLREELGDVLMQVVFHADIERQRGRFTMEDVVDGVVKKLIFRHPHVFGGAEPEKDAQSVLVSWDAIKRREKHQRTTTQAMDSVARSLPALWRAEKLQKKAAEVIEGENLDILIGSRPLKEEKDEKKKEAVKNNVLRILGEKYGVEEEDFLSAELEIVPAGKARDCGLDRSMVAAYGQDDRVCAYTSFVAMLEMEAPKRTSCCLLTDKEEIGSVGATGMQSNFFENTVAELLEAMGCYSGLALRRTLKNSFMLSSDVSAGYDPAYGECFEKKNAAYLGRGIVLNKFTGARGKSGSNDANAEYVAKVRGIFDDSNVAFQTAELGKVDVGGGGTIAYIAALYGMNVIDSGVAVLSMHAPWEVTSKADIYEAKKAYKAFLENA